MKLLIKFPTRGRSEKFLNVLKKYYNFLDDKTTTFIISCDIDDESMQEEHVKEVLSNYNNVYIHYGNNKTKIEAVNADINSAIDFDILLLASDDMIPMVKGFDTIIKNKMKEHYPDTDGVLWFNDGFQGEKLNTLCILGKKYYDRFNYIYNPGYLSVWCDNEFMDVANLLGKQTYFNDVIIKHMHPVWGFGELDDIHKFGIKNEDIDKNLYFKRKKENFGINI